MGAEQQALDTLTYTIDEMEYIAQQNPEREDIRACIEEIKEKVKADESTHWAIINYWGEHFDGITASDDDEAGDEDKDDEDEPDDDEAGDEDKDDD
jgi:hypothetical protein